MYFVILVMDLRPREMKLLEYQGAHRRLQSEFSMIWFVGTPSTCFFVVLKAL